MNVIFILTLALLLTAVLEAYRIFSYLTSAFILAVVASAAIERADRGLTLEPYTNLVVGLAVLFVIGLMGIWLLWRPGVSTYTYVFGFPQPTLVYVLFLWLLPLFGAVYYAVAIFPVAVFGLNWKGATKEGAIAGIVGGLVVNLFYSAVPRTVETVGMTGFSEAIGSLNPFTTSSSWLPFA